MDHVFSPNNSRRRAAAALGALVCTLAVCTACTGTSSPGAANSNSTATGSGSQSSAAPGSATTSSNTGGGTANGAAASPKSATGGGSTTGNGSSTGGGSSSGGTGGSGGSGGITPACQTSNLSAGTAASQGTAGSTYVDIVFRNTGSSPCSMYGYPGVSLAAGSPAGRVGQPADRNALVSPLIVTLLPNGHAFAVLQIADAGNYPASTCDPKPTTALQVYPPNNTSALDIPYSSMACAADIVTAHVEAVQSGAGPQ